MKDTVQQVSLLFLMRGDEILLAMKKRRFGAGMWNGAGGKADPGETIEETAIRECQEEIGVTPTKMEKVGEFDFYLTDQPDFNQYSHVYVCTEWQGEPVETEEMRPQWFKLSDIPYDQMWAADRRWLPLMIDGKKFTGRITIGPNDSVDEYDVAVVESL